MFLLAAALTLAIHQPSKITYRLMATTEVRSPVAPSAVLIRDRRRAYEFFGLLRDRANKPLFLKRMNWNRQSVLVIYPGFVQKDAQISIPKILKRGRTLYPYVVVKRGITAETYYPAMLFTIPRQPKGTLVYADFKTVSVLAMRIR
jgi:hypothetical protein